MTPTDTATRNLRNEGIDQHRIRQVGDVMYDAALFYGDRAERHNDILDRLGLVRDRYVLATVHRQENTDAPRRFDAIVEALNDVSATMPVVWLVHPRTRQLLDADAAPRVAGTVKLVDPVGYLDMVMLERSAIAIATDSGGVQKEAFFHATPCVTLRDETEWTELIDLGWNRLAPPEQAGLADTIIAAFDAVGRPGKPYGNGKAADKVIRTLLGN